MHVADPCAWRVAPLPLRLVVLLVVFPAVLLLVCAQPRADLAVWGACSRSMSGGGGPGGPPPTGAATEANCTMLVSPDKVAAPTEAELMGDLESDSLARKVSALKKIVTLTVAGEPMPRLLMHVIRFCITQEDHELKK